jgi:hypothetical protein
MSWFVGQAVIFYPLEGRMLLFLASVVEQLDLALEHIAKGDVHNARFGLMLTDNALELVLHQIVKEKRSDAAGWRYRDDPYPYEAQLRKAFLGSFSDKVAFARLDAGLDPRLARSFNILHDYRNEVYHAGLAHQDILPSLARLYFDAGCHFISTYRPRGLGWGSSQKMPERAQKYFQGERHFPGKRDDFTEACKAMAEANGFDADTLVAVLSDDVDRIVDDMDTCIQICADGVYIGQQTSRDEAVLSTQVWDLAFADGGKGFLAARGFRGSMTDAIDFLGQEYPFRYRRDPIPGWQAQAKKLRSNGNPHSALDHYRGFIEQTASLRAALEQSAAAAEAEIEAASDRMRGK